MDKKHELDAIALIYARCSCGKEFRVERLRGKTDEELSIETHVAFQKHQRRAQEK